MINDSHIEELRSRFYYVSQQFGGARELATQLDLASPSIPLEEKVSIILSHPEEIGVVTPWEPIFSLVNNSQPDLSIIQTLPYQVHDLDGRLIYKVIEHEGFFGGSPIDKVLLLQSLSGDMYYVQFPSYQGSRTLLLIVNNLALEYSNPISDRDLLKAPPPSIREPANNFITIDSSEVLSGEDLISIYLLPTKVLVTPPIEQLLRDPLVKREDYYLSSSDPLIIYIPHSSGWLYITKSGLPLKLTNISGAGDDRLVIANEFLSYIALGDEMDTNLIRQTLGISSRRPPGFSTTNLIRLSASLST